MGPFGSGKSTSALSWRQDRADGAAVSLANHDITRPDDNQLTQLRHTKIVFVFQFFNPLDYPDRRTERHSIATVRESTSGYGSRERRSRLPDYGSSIASVLRWPTGASCIHAQPSLTPATNP